MAGSNRYAILQAWSTEAIMILDYTITVQQGRNVYNLTKDGAVILSSDSKAYVFAKMDELYAKRPEADKVAEQSWALNHPDEAGFSAADVTKSFQDWRRVGRSADVN